MKMIKWLVIGAVVWQVGLVSGQIAPNSMFSDHRAHRVGDIITILVVEYSSASSEAQTSSVKDNEHGFVATGGAGNQSYSPMYGLRGDLRNRFNGDASVSRKGSLKTKITASIIEIDGNGNLVIQGSRAVEVNGEREETTITGSVRSQDVSGANTVYSYQLSDAQISYSGKGVVNSGQKPGMLTKLLNWIF